MGLLNELGLAGAGVAPSSISDAEKQMASGGLPPEGVHHAVLEAAGGIPNAEGRGWKLTFKIVAGPGKDATVEDVLWKPKGDDEKKDKSVRNRVLIFGHRLGLLKKVVAADGKSEVAVEVEGKHDFGDCLGDPCFIEVKHEDEEFEAKDKDGHGTGKKRTIKKAKLTFEGLISPEDKKKLAGVAVATSLPAPGTVGKPSGGAKGDQFSDI